MEKYKVFISTTGTGSRLGSLTKYLNKSLLNVGTKPVLTRIIEKFPKDSEFVITVGYKGELVKEYLKLAHSDLNVQIVEVSPYEGEGSGLGYTMSVAEKYLQCPFYFCSCDTLVKEDIPRRDSSWVGIRYELSDDPRYRTIHLNEDGLVDIIYEKGEYGYPYIGLCFIKEYRKFWEGMHAAKSPEFGEVEGLRNIISFGIQTKFFTWDDTGSVEGLSLARKRYTTKNDPNILPKEDETLWILEDKVIKFFNNPQIVKDRVERVKSLKEYVPTILDVAEHMYSYKKVEGKVLSDCITVPVFKKLLDTSFLFWQGLSTGKLDEKQFRQDCIDFYQKKTYSRVEKFYSRFEKDDRDYIINGVRYPKLKYILDNLDWTWICEGVPGRFHGDFHDENILYDGKKFTFLDWRQNFGHSLEIGDIYYDFAKLRHGLIVNHGLINKNLFTVTWKDDEISYDFCRKHVLVECEQEFLKWIVDHDFDSKKVSVMTALIFLNICGLHEAPYSYMLYALGKEMLCKTVCNYD